MNYAFLMIIACALSATSTVTPSSSISLSSGMQAGTGALVGGCAAAVLAKKISNALCWSNNDAYKNYHYGLIAASTVAGLYAGWKLLFRCTPEGRLERARSELAGLSTYQLSVLEKYQYDEVMLRKTLQNDYIAYPFPLVTAFHVIQSMRNTIIDAQDLLYAAKSGQDKRSLLAQECKQLISQTNDILQTMQRTIAILTSSSDWAAMFTAYNNAQALAVQQAMLLQMQLNAIQPHYVYRY